MRGKAIESIGYSTIIEVENAAYNYKYKFESATCKRNINITMLLRSNEILNTTETQPKVNELPLR